MPVWVNRVDWRIEHTAKKVAATSLTYSIPAYPPPRPRIVIPIQILHPAGEVVGELGAEAEGVGVGGGAGGAEGVAEGVVFINGGEAGAVGTYQSGHVAVAVEAGEVGRRGWGIGDRG